MKPHRWHGVYAQNHLTSIEGCEILGESGTHRSELHYHVPWGIADASTSASLAILSFLLLSKPTHLMLPELFLNFPQTTQSLPY